MKAPIRTHETPPEETKPESRSSLVTLDEAISAAAVVLAALIAALILLPSGVWHQPATDAVYRGFDPNLMYISPSGPASAAGVVSISNNELAITAKSNSPIRIRPCTC